HLEAPVPKVKERRPDCPPSLDAAVQRALAKKPDGRFETVAQLLEAIRAGQPRAAAPAGAPVPKPAAAAPVAPAPIAPAPVQSMGPATTPAPAATPAPAPRSPSLKETQALTSLGPKTREPRKT